MKLINENTYYTDNEKHTYMDENDQEIVKKNKITILYSEDPLNI